MSPIFASDFLSFACLMEFSRFRQQQDSQIDSDNYRLSKMKEETEDDEVDVVSLEDAEGCSTSCLHCLEEEASCQTFRKRQRSTRLLSDDVPEPSIKRKRIPRPPPLLIPVDDDRYFDEKRITPIKPVVRTISTRCKTDMFYDSRCVYPNLALTNRSPDGGRLSAFELFERVKVKEERSDGYQHQLTDKVSADGISNKNIFLKEEFKPKIEENISDGSDLAPTRPTSPSDEISVKKMKNKEASKHYREKKKNAIHKVFQEEKELTQRNQQLQKTLKDLQRYTQILQKNYASRINSKQRIKEEVCRLISKSKKSDFSDIAQEVNVLQKVLQEVANDSSASGYVESAIYEIWGEILKVKN